jgi:hypothetical protein
LDTINKTTARLHPIFKKVFRLWSLYHMNDMRAGTVEQIQAIEDGVKNGKLAERHTYDDACTYLKDCGLYEVVHDGASYKYGTKWIYQDIPEKDLIEIKEIMQCA